MISKSHKNYLQECDISKLTSNNFNKGENITC